MALAKGDHVPHFTAADTAGRPVAYGDLWQHRNLLLVSLSDDADADASYRAALAEHIDELMAHDTAVVVTRDRIAGIPHPGVLVADRWGEIHWIAGPLLIGNMPGPDELIEWLRYVQMQCPECQGETR